MAASVPHETGQLLTTVTEGDEILGYLAVDTTVGGRSCGGLRMVPDVDEPRFAGWPGP